VTGISKRVDHLADGRELIYFDDAFTSLAGERAPDRRTLGPRPPTAVLREDILTGDWISIASARQARAVMPPADLDPLAPQSPTNPSEIPDMYDVVVFENRSPSFGPAVASDSSTLLPDGFAGPGLNRETLSFGRCEVICFTPARDGGFGSVTASRARTIIEAWVDRTAALSSLPGVRQVFPFENRGAQIGVTLQHPHGQIYAYPYITPRTRQLIRQVDAYGPQLFADILETELAGPRVVLAGEYWTAFVPFAARWPIEVHLLPHRHVADFAETSFAQREELATIYLKLLRGIDALYDDATPYIAAWHQAPVNTHRDSIRLHLQLTSPRRGVDKFKYLAGSEAAMGAWVADISPELQADKLREAIAAAEESHPRTVERSAEGRCEKC
jgi:UDPglucose--hexose-1-phosphate uridylyltransferase